MVIQTCKVRSLAGTVVRANFILGLYGIAAQGAAPRFHVTDLGTLGGQRSEALDINNSGMIVGTSINSAGQQRGFLYQNGVMNELPTLGGIWGEACGVNGTGQLAGAAYASAGGCFAYMYDHGASNPIPQLGYGNAEGKDINNALQVAGYANLTSQTYHAFRYDFSDHTMHDLGTGTFGGTNSEARGINSSGQVVGAAYLSGNAHYHAFRYSGTTMSDLGTLGGPDSVANRINDAGRVVGVAYLNATVGHAFRYDGAMHDLGALGSDTYSYASDLNMSDQVVGFSNGSGAFLWENGMMSSLNDLLDDSGANWFLGNAEGIDDSGQIVGGGEFDPDGPGPASSEFHAFLLTSVPEPASALFLLTSTAMTLRAKRKPLGGREL